MKLRKIFAIIDPTSDNSLLIARLGRMVERAEAAEKVTITAYCVHYSSQPTSDEEMLKKVATQRFEMWLESLFSDLKARGVKVIFQIEWNSDWRDALINAVDGANCDIVVKNSYSHKSKIGRLSKQIDRAILRVAKAPVSMLRKNNVSGNGIILAALKTADLDEAHQRANDRILEHCKAMVDVNPRFDTHVVSCYSGSDNFNYPGDLAEKAGVDRTKAHTFDGSPTKGIETVARKLDAEIVFIGSIKREGVAGKLLGNTADQLLDSLDSDIIALVDRE